MSQQPAKIRSQKDLASWVEGVIEQLDQVLAAQGITDSSSLPDPAVNAALKNALALWESLSQLLTSRQN